MTSRDIVKANPIKLDPWLRTVRNSEDKPIGVEEFMHSLVEARVLHLDRYRTVTQGVISLDQITTDTKINEVYRRVLGAKEEALVAQTMPLYENCIRALFEGYSEDYLTEFRESFELHSEASKIRLLLHPKYLRPNLIRTLWGEINPDVVKANNGIVPTEDPATAAYLIQEMILGKRGLHMRDFAAPVQMIGDIFPIANDEHVSDLNSSSVPYASFLREKSRTRTLVKGVGTLVRAIDRFKRGELKPISGQEEDFERTMKIYENYLARYKAEEVGLERFWDRDLRYAISNAAPIKDIIGMTFLYQGGHHPETRTDGVAGALSKILNHPYVADNYEVMQRFDDYHNPRPGINLHRIKLTLRPKANIITLPDRSPIEIIIGDVRNYFRESEFGTESHTGKYSRVRAREKMDPLTQAVVRLDRGQRGDDTDYFSNIFTIENATPSSLHHPLRSTDRQT